MIGERSLAESLDLATSTGLLMVPGSPSRSKIWIEGKVQCYHFLPVYCGDNWLSVML
jgi:hypothetical protein